MEVTIDRDVLFPVLDTLLTRWKARPKKYPYDRPDALIPQNLIPAELRANKTALACFYFYVCIYMRGGIESAQAFNALLRMRAKHPELFDPWQAQHFKPSEVQLILKRYIGWDSKAASINWVENSTHLVQIWKGDPLHLIKGVTDYDEALRRIRNKRTKRDKVAAGPDGAGFRGFQPKMVSMLIYFYDWEGWLKKRFLFPAPADFHNFRLGLNQGAIVVSGNPSVVKPNEKLSKAWRDALMEYLVSRKADPVEVADAIWMFSLVMCGNSPLNSTRVQQINGSGIFSIDMLPHDDSDAQYRSPKFRAALLATCLRCPLVNGCKLSIPSKPYYTKGNLVLRPRPRVEEFFGRFDPDSLRAVTESSRLPNRDLFDPDA